MFHPPQGKVREGTGGSWAQLRLEHLPGMTEASQQALPPPGCSHTSPTWSPRALLKGTPVSSDQPQTTPSNTPTHRETERNPREWL